MPKFPEFFLPAGVRPIPGEPLRFYVASRSRRRDEHLVDLEECGFNGACGCENFQFVQLKKLRDDRKAGKEPRTHRCWHIVRALIFNSELHVRIMSRRLNKAQLEPKPTRPLCSYGGVYPEQEGKRVYQLDRSTTYKPK